MCRLRTRGRGETFILGCFMKWPVPDLGGKIGDPENASEVSTVYSS